MTKLMLRYNPYRVKTELCLLSDDGETSMSEEAALMWMAQMRMQRWLSEDCPRNFFDELRSNLGEDEIEILFSGTAEDMEDLIRAADRYMQTHPDASIRISAGDKTELKNSAKQKVAQLKRLIDQAKNSPYHKVIPERFWKQLDQLLLPETEQLVRIELENWQQEGHKAFDGDAWQQVCLHFPFERMGSKTMRQALRAFSRTINIDTKREWERERFMLICECPEAVMSDIARTKDIVKKILLEYGIYDLNVYLILRKECRLLYAPDAREASAQLNDARKAREMYSRYYAGQYRLQQKSDAILKSLRDAGFVKDDGLFRKVEKIMRQHPSFRSVRDAQIFQGYEWVQAFLGSLEHWLDIDAA